MSKKKTSKGAPAPPVEEPHSSKTVQQKAPLTARKGKSKGTAQAAGASATPPIPATLTLQEVAKGYLQALEEKGASEGTLFGYRMELKRAMKVLGAETRVVDLTPAAIAAYNRSDAVMKSKSGRPLAPRSVDKTRRVLRLALVWAGAGALIPEEEGKRAAKAQKAKVDLAEPVAA